MKSWNLAFKSEKFDLRETELEIELPGRVIRSSVSIFIHKCETKLDNLEEIDVTAEQLILVVGGRSKFANRSSDDTWKSQDYYTILQSHTNLPGNSVSIAT